MAEPSVLRYSVLGDVHAGQDLDACDHRWGKRGNQLRYVMKDTVDAHTHPKVIGRRLEVNVARSLGRGSCNDALDQLYRGAFRRLVFDERVECRRFDDDIA